MKIKEIIKLPKTKESISIIKSFLQTSLTSSDYANAFFCLQECYLELELYSDLIKDTLNYIKDFADLKSDNYDKVLLNLIKGYLGLKLYDDAKEVLPEFRKYVKVMDEYLVIYYDILIKKELGEPYLDDIRKAIKVALPNNIKEDYLKELVFYYLKMNDYKTSYEALLNLKALTGNDYLSKSLFLLNKLNRYEEMKELIFSNGDKPENAFICNLYMLIIKLNEKEYHKATIYEAEATANISTATLEEKSLFYEAGYNLYNELDNNFLKDYYLKELNELNKEKQKEEQKRKRTVTKLKEELSKSQETVTVEDKTTKTVETSSKFELSKEEEKRQILNIIDVIAFSNSIDKDLKLRDFFRTFFIYLDNYYLTLEHNIYLYNGDSYYYIKERLYDKQILEESLDNTIIRLNNNIPQYKIYSKDDIKDLNNIYNNQLINEKANAAMTIPLEDIGVYIIYFDDIEIAKTSFTFFETISKLILGKIIKDKVDKIFREENFFLKSVLRSDLFPLKYQSKTKSYYNKEASNLLSIPEDAPIGEFYKKINPKYVYDHKNTITFLEQNIGKTLTLEYEYLGKSIKERITSFTFQESPVLVSIFTDVTSHNLKVYKLEEKSNRDPEFNIYTLNYLLLNFQNYLQGKTTFIKINLDTSLKNLYSFDLFQSYLKEFIMLTDNFFTDGDMFKVTEDEFIVIIPINDTRAVTNLINSYEEFIYNIEPKSIKFLKFKTHIATLRYPVVTTTKNADLIMRFLSITLNLAKVDPVNNYLDFIYSYYEDDVFEQLILDNINKSLEENRLKLILKPFVDIRKNIVNSYEANLILEGLNIDAIYIKKIAEKKGQIEAFERGLILRTFSFLKEIESRTDGYFSIIISLSNDTVFNPDFNAWFKAEAERYDVPLSFIRIKLDTRIRNYRVFEKNLKELYEMGLTIDTSDLNLLMSFPVNGFFYSLKKLEIKKQAYLKHLNEFLKEYNVGLFIDDVLSKEDLEMLKSLTPTGVSATVYEDLTEYQLLKRLESENNNEN